MSEQYLSVNEYLKSKYGCKVYKLALNGGRTCPNRDGCCGTGGCIFCGEGSGSFASDTIDEAIDRLANKNTGNRYIAYFQSFTSTYKLDDDIKNRMLSAAMDERVVTVSVATRPDCLGPDVMEFLKKLKSIKPLWVELGLQTIHPDTAHFINRGYELEIFDQAVRILRAIGAEVIVHLILGLPGESREKILESVRYLNGKDVQGVKLQLLHILEGTKLGEMYKLGKISWECPEKNGTLDIAEQDDLSSDCSMASPQNSGCSGFPMDLESYADLLIECVGSLRPDIVIHRITGDAPKRLLIEPKWSGNKKNVLNKINKRFEDSHIKQGSLM